MAAAKIRKGDRVVVRTTQAPDDVARLTCKALRDNSVPRHELVEVARLR